ncbi:amidohydrolase family domain-containing protein [Ditylenchus destructor]|uniref:Amidohydrolase family domain-containing protein n=1 Tax=Ditylenchus destructor TaxID=166010 RepID=A0AAD4R4K3_9BILA|nr:amidohydrolase family domain-containing protein [Ditylenchus destructor]
MDYRGKRICASLTWFEDSFQPNIIIHIDNAGKIRSIDKNLDDPNANVLCLPNIALMPGFVNAHSHAFHRYLRGHSEIGTPGADNFWKWRDNMYRLLDDITYDQLKQYCKGTFVEMLASGITTVGEFHYVHHSGNSRFDLDGAVLDAATEAGIRLVLIETLYCRSGFQSSSLTEQQASFGSTIPEFIPHVESLLDKISQIPDASLAIAAHSLRAVDIHDFTELLKWSKTRHIPLHLHLEEQPKEIEDCLAAHGTTPSQLLLRSMEGIASTATLTAVHCTFTHRKELDELNAKGIHICVCPATEGFLGDGIPTLNESDKICLGTDCNNRISFLEEMRWLCFCQNMKSNSRNCSELNAGKLIQIATENGASSLGLGNHLGKFQQGHFMDFIGFDLNSQRLRGFSSPQRLADAIVFGCGNTEVCITGVSGQVKFHKNG